MLKLALGLSGDGIREGSQEMEAPDMGSSKADLETRIEGEATDLGNEGNPGGKGWGE